MSEGGKVRSRLSARASPSPLLTDALGESQFQDHIETVVRGLRHGTKEPIDLHSSDKSDRHPTHQMNVAERIQREADAIQFEVALQQPAIDADMGLIGIAGNKSPDVHRMLSQLEGTFGDQLAGAGQSDREQAGCRFAPVKIEFG